MPETVMGCLGAEIPQSLWPLQHGNKFMCMPVDAQDVLQKQHLKQIKKDNEKATIGTKFITGCSYSPSCAHIHFIK